MTAVRLVRAMSRDERFPGYRVSPRFHTPLAATTAVFVIAELILAVFALQTDALFILFSAATLLPALIYAATVALYIAERNSLPPSQGFSRGRWETPVIVLAVIWLIFELTLFRDASFAASWLYIVVMVAIGGVYLVALLVKRGGPGGLTTPDMHNIDAELDADGNERR